METRAPSMGERIESILKLRIRGIGRAYGKDDTIVWNFLKKKEITGVLTT